MPIMNSGAYQLIAQTTLLEPAAMLSLDQRCDEHRQSDYILDRAISFRIESARKPGKGEKAQKPAGDLTSGKDRIVLEQLQSASLSVASPDVDER